MVSVVPFFLISSFYAFSFLPLAAATPAHFYGMIQTSVGEGSASPGTELRQAEQSFVDDRQTATI